jgi:ketosteroid isomerase-like protein
LTGFQEARNVTAETTTPGDEVMTTWLLVRVAFCTLAFLLVLGCGSQVDLEAEKAAVRQADTDFSTASEKRDFESFLTFISDSASFYSQGGQINRGRKAVGDDWKPLFDPAGPSLTWRPTDADVSASGDLGYTRGVWKVVVDGPQGHREGTGKYVTIWRKEADGKWRVVVDIGNPDQAPEASAPPPPPAADSAAAPGGT